ncbi:MAG TPA: peptidase M36, partial [Blastocatellia bacterium]|nr:peptidase M36 [Blastocatellia bacterium]
MFALLLTLSIFTVGPNIGATISGAPVAAADLDLTGGRVRDFDINLSQYVSNLPTAQQLAAVESLKASLGDANITVHWDKATGSVDTIYDFASAPSPLEPEEAARAFIQANAALFGISDMSTLQLKRNVAALGGHLLYFQQTHNGLPVVNGGIGVMMDGERRIRMLSGPYHSTLQTASAPTLDAAAAIAAAEADLAPFTVPWAAGVADVLNPALDLLASKLGPFATPQPELNVYPTPGGARLAWKFYYFSRNPFGMFKYQVDALTGQVLYREDFVRYQQEALPFTADFYPTYPAITPELKDQGIISVDATGKPLGQLRIQLRNFDASNVVTGVNGTLTGLHAHIENALALKLPFAQAAKGTWHFREDNPANLEARTNERDHFGPAAEPAEHQDEISQFIYINSVIEYIDYLHRAGDAAHSAFGEGDFPDTYPNQATPLVGIVHIPNVLAPPTNPQDPAFLDKLLGLDNAFSLSVSDEIAGQEVVVNPTAYGHGYLLNDLAIDFSVP